MNDDFRHTLLANCDSLKNLAVPIIPCNPQPGGHFIGRPPNRWRCKWNTVCPPSGLVLTTTRYPRSAIAWTRALAQTNPASPPERGGSVDGMCHAGGEVEASAQRV